MIRVAWRWLLLLVLTVAGCLSGAISTQSAQADEGGIPAFALNCTADPGIVAAANVNPKVEELCTGAAGVRIVAMTGDGGFESSCVTDERGRCGLGVLVYSPTFQHVVYENVDDLPPGFQPRLNPSRGALYTEFAQVTFVNLPIAGAEQAAGAGSETVTLYGALCPADVDPAHAWETCYDTPATTFGYRVVNPETGVAAPQLDIVAANEAGFAWLSLRGVAPGLVRIEITPLQPDPTTVDRALVNSRTVAAGCRDANATRLPVALSGAALRSVTLAIPPGADLRCDVYLAPGGTDHVHSQSAPGRTPA